jgi:hypothetical protein
MSEILSAAYLRARLMAICTLMAAIGANSSMSRDPTTPRPRCYRAVRRRTSQIVQAWKSRRREATAGRVCRGPAAAWLSSSGDPCRVGPS